MNGDSIKNYQYTDNERYVVSQKLVNVTFYIKVIDRTIDSKVIHLVSTELPETAKVLYDFFTTKYETV